MPEEQESQNPDIQQAQEGQPDGVQKRIDTVTRKWRETERERDDVLTQNAALQQQLTDLTSKVESLAPRDTEFADLFGSSQTVRQPAKGKGTPSEDLAHLVKQNVQEALAPLVQETQEAERKRQLQLQQLQSFNSIAEFFPDLRQDGSDAQQLFNEIWTANPDIAVSPNGPALVGNAVVGILQQDARAVQQDARKVAASGPTPTHDLSNRLDIKDTDQDTLKKDAIATLTEKGRSVEGLTPNEQMNLLGLKLGRARIKEA